jgi:hypothetical protein
MSFTLVHVSGLSPSSNLDNDQIESLLEARYDLSSDDNINNGIAWAGPGTTIIKRDDATNRCRGYCFLSFYTLEGASIAVDSINAIAIRGEGGDIDIDVDSSAVVLPLQLHAELSKPKPKASTKKKTKTKTSQETDHSDLRIRRKRGAPIRKHPVIISSDKSKTGLGNKTR